MLRTARPGGVVCVVGLNLLGFSPFTGILWRHVWRARPLRRLLLRDAQMPRHPFGNTLPEVAAALGRNLRMLAAKGLRPGPRFTMRISDLCPPFHADNDACYLCNPLDLAGFFRRAGCAVVQGGTLGRPSFVRALASGTWIAAHTPPAPEARR